MVRKRMVSTVMSLMMAAAVLTTVPVTNNVKAADKEITSGDYTYVKESNGKTSYAVLTSYKGSETNLVIPEELDGLQVKAISQGFEKNLNEKIRSERMKTELITNVSHDLKTPLTSIISYVDLLERRNDLPPEAVDYVKIISKKAVRLKNMVYDVFELAKTASGELVIACLLYTSDAADEL